MTIINDINHFNIVKNCYISEVLQYNSTTYDTLQIPYTIPEMQTNVIQWFCRSFEEEINSYSISRLTKLFDVNIINILVGLENEKLQFIA